MSNPPFGNTILVTFEDVDPMDVRRILNKVQSTGLPHDISVESRLREHNNVEGEKYTDEVPEVKPVIAGLDFDIDRNQYVFFVHPQDLEALRRHVDLVEAETRLSEFAPVLMKASEVRDGTEMWHHINPNLKCSSEGCAICKDWFGS